MFRFSLVFLLCGILLSPGILYSQAIVSLPQVVAEKDSLVMISVAVDLKEYEVLCYEFEVNFNPAVAVPLGASKDSTLSEMWSGPYVNTGFAGKVKIAGLDLPNSGAATNAIRGSGTLVNLLFKVIGNNQDSTALNFTYFKFQADYPPVLTVGGVLRVIENGTSFVMKPFKAQTPQEMMLYPNFPDPMNEVTTILYQLKNNEQVMVKIYDLLGREVLVLVNEPQIPGVHAVVWDGRDQHGDLVPIGLYFCFIKTAMSNQLEKITIIK